ncbi:hypothetical protein G5B41_14370 [bacterium SGD-2]|jgi:hypothetical protein|nr:hypothetical protein [bacterium SGD-2]
MADEGQAGAAGEKMPVAGRTMAERGVGCGSGYRMPVAAISPGDWSSIRALRILPDRLIACYASHSGKRSR